MTSRKLDEIAANLDDLSVTLEEIREEMPRDPARGIAKLDEVEREMGRAADAIEESLANEPSGED